MFRTRTIARMRIGMNESCVKQLVGETFHELHVYLCNVHHSTQQYKRAQSRPPTAIIISINTITKIAITSQGLYIQGEYKTLHHLPPCQH